MQQTTAKLLLLVFVIRLEFCKSSEKQLRVISTSDITLAHRNGRPNLHETTPLTISNENGISGGTVKIPLKLIRDWNSEDDVVNVFRKYVSNVRVNELNGQSFLVDLNNKPIGTTVGESKPRVPFKGFTFRTPPRRPSNQSGTPVSTSFTRTGIVGGFSPADRIGLQTPEEIITRAAGCEPELKTVEVPVKGEHEFLVIPKCVRIHQCGGCCGSNLLKCEPVNTTRVQVQVNRFQYQAESNELEYVKTELIEIQAATKCRCACRVKPRDCSPLQEHDHNECECVCKNASERLTCQENPEKQWDRTNCRCECREIKECTSGHMFNPETCECQPGKPGTTSQTQDPSTKKRHRRTHKRRQS